jgi:hypothetical protein
MYSQIFSFEKIISSARLAGAEGFCNNSENLERAP